jgi:hypothetical protein
VRLLRILFLESVIDRNPDAKDLGRGSIERIGALKLGIRVANIPSSA